MKGGVMFAVAALSLMAMPFNAEPMPAPRRREPSRGELARFVSREGQMHPTQLHKLARKNKRRGRR